MKKKTVVGRRSKAKKTKEVEELLTKALAKKKLSREAGAKLLSISVGYMGHVCRGSHFAVISEDLANQFIKRLGVPAAPLRRILPLHNKKVRECRRKNTA